MVKVLQIAMNEGIDPMDGQKKNGPVELLPLSELTTFEAFYAQYRRLLDWYFEKCARDQLHSYEVMNREVSFLFASALMDDCLARGKALLDGGVRILGGTLETYGNINASDALTAVKRLVFEERKYTLEEMNEAASRDFQETGNCSGTFWRFPSTATMSRKPMTWRMICTNSRRNLSGRKALTWAWIIS